MRMKLLMLLFILLFVMGCATFGIKKDKTECDQILESDGTLRATTDGEKVSCYRELAVSLAWISNANDAKDVCNDIRHLGISNPDIQYLTASNANLCYADVAKIARPYDQTICDNIQEPSLIRGLSGGAVTKDLCKKRVKNLEENDPRSYLGGSNNICSIVFIIPLLAFYIHKF